MAQRQVAKARIVVGVDGSEQSRRALRWALRYARQADAVVEAVMAWEPPFSGQGGASAGRRRSWARSPSGC